MWDPTGAAAANVVVLVDDDVVELAPVGPATVGAASLRAVAADLAGIDDGSAFVGTAWLRVDFPAAGRWDRATELAVHAVLERADHHGCEGVAFADDLPVDQVAELAAAVASSPPGPTTAALHPASRLLVSGGADGLVAWYDTAAGPRVVRSPERGWLAFVACARQVTELAEHAACGCPGDALIAQVARGREPAVLALERALRVHHVHVLAARLEPHAAASL